MVLHEFNLKQNEVNNGPKAIEIMAVVIMYYQNNDITTRVLRCRAAIFGFATSLSCSFHHYVLVQK